jgi:hypothetical protein
MARVEPRSLHQNIKLPLFSVDAAKFFDLVCEKFSPDISISATIGDWKSPTKTILDNRQDILSHLSLLNNSFEMHAGNIKIKLSKLESIITFEESQRVAVEAILADLNHYVPLYKRAIMLFSANKAFLISAVCLVYAIIRSEASVEKFGQLTSSEKNFVYTIAMLPLFAKNFALWVRPRVFYRLKDNFFRRNRDQIIWAFFAYLAGNLTPDFSVIKGLLLGALGLTGP